MKYGYLIALALSALVSALVTSWVRNFAVGRGWVRPPSSSRHVHRVPTPRVGGLAIFVATSCVVAADFFFPNTLGSMGPVQTREVGILIPAAMVFALGLYDDVRPLGARFKVVVEAAAAVLLYLGHFRVSHMDMFFGTHALKHVIALPLTVFWVLLITNAFNLIDGLDGLAAGSALFSTLVIFVVSLFLSNSFVSLAAIVLAGAILGFLPFNFHPAKIFLGDSGSLFIGFLLSALGLAGSQKAPTMVAVAIPVVSFGLPILDVLVAVSRRFLRGKPLFEADREHIHHKLLAQGLSHRDTVLVLYGVTASFGLLSLSLLHGQQFIAVVLAVAGSGICLGVQRLGYQEFSELQRVARRTVEQRTIIANHLVIRHAAESLNTCHSYAELRKILRETFLPLGFDGFECMFPPEDSRADSARASRENDQDVSSQLESRRIPSKAAWTLALVLTTASGNPCGSFYLYRCSCDTPLLLDIDLLTGEFQAALTRALERSLLSTDHADRDWQSAPLALSVRAGSN